MAQRSLPGRADIPGGCVRLRAQRPQCRGGRDGEAWEWWIQALTQIVQRHDLPYGARIVGTSGEPSPFVALVRALQEHVPARHMFSDEALAKAIQRARAAPGDK